MLRDDLASNNMNYITWIIIILIVIAVIVAAGKKSYLSSMMFCVIVFECVDFGNRISRRLGRWKDGRSDRLLVFVSLNFLGEIVVKYLSHFGSDGAEPLF